MLWLGQCGGRCGGVCLDGRYLFFPRCNTYSLQGELSYAVTYFSRFNYEGHIVSFSVHNSYLLVDGFDLAETRKINLKNILLDVPFQVQFLLSEFQNTKGLSCVSDKILAGHV